MGTTIAVASVVHNLAGPEEHRPNYLKSVVVRNVLSRTKNSMGESLTNAYLYGPAIKFRQFYRWADNPDNYGEVGMPTGVMQAVGEVDPNAVAPHIPHGAGTEVWAQSASAGRADSSKWASRYILDNRPDDHADEWTSDYDPDTNEIILQFPSEAEIRFAAVDFDLKAWYIYCYYAEVEDAVAGPIDTGDTIVLEPEEDWPSTVGWTRIQYDDTIPTHNIYMQEVITTPTSGVIVKTVTKMHLFYDGTDRSYRIDVQEFTTSFGDLSLFIYRIGSGNAVLDALFEENADFGKFFPFIPIRLKNKFLSETYLPAAFEQTKKAYRKATGSKLSKLVAQLEDNEDLEDIDHVYIVFGVSLNVVENACRKYLYHFFKQLELSQTGGQAAFDAWMDFMLAQKAIAEAWYAWREDPLGPEPPRPTFKEPPKQYINMKGTGEINSHYDMTLEWNFIGSGSTLGLGKPDAKKDDLWMEFVEEISMDNYIWDERRETLVNEPVKIERCRLYWQKADKYDYIETLGLVHENLVYGWESVRITAKEALEDPSESGFLVPMHEATWRTMSIIETTQMATACVFIVFNCYEVHKSEWYESGIFRILLVIVIAIISVVFTGGAGIGLLGAHMSVGAALGFSGMTAAIIGSVVNALAAMVLATVLEVVTRSLGILGPIIGFLLMFVIGAAASSFANGGTFAINWGDLLRVDNLLKMTSALADGFTNMLYGDAMSIQQQMVDFNKKAALEADKIQQAYFKEFGYGAGIIDPNMFVDSTKMVVESSDTFLTRTLLTGSEIADMSVELLSDFAYFSLKLPDAFT